MTVTVNEIVEAAKKRFMRVMANEPLVEVYCPQPIGYEREGNIASAIANKSYFEDCKILATQYVGREVSIGRVPRTTNPVAVNDAMLRALIAVRSFGSHGVIDDDGPNQGMSVSYFVESAIAMANEAVADCGSVAVN